MTTVDIAEGRRLLAADDVRMALRAAITDLPQPTLGLAGGVNRGAVIDAIERVFSNAEALLAGTPDLDVEEAEQKANDALAALGLHLRRWQPTRCSYGGGGCSFPASSHPDLIPAHDFQSIPDGPEQFVLEALREAPDGR